MKLSFLRSLLGTRTAACSRRSVPRSLHEALEPRLVLSAISGSPPVEMLSATATDSRSVTIDYRMNQAPSPEGPLSFGIFRSSDSRFDTQDVSVGSWQVGALAPSPSGL